MDGIRAIKVNNIINEDLTFKFDGHPVDTALISFRNKKYAQHEADFRT